MTELTSQEISAWLKRVEEIERDIDALSWAKQTTGTRLSIAYLEAELEKLMEEVDILIEQELI
jgi:hypothetical protein